MKRYVFEIEVTSTVEITVEAADRNDAEEKANSFADNGDTANIEISQSTETFNVEFLHAEDNENNNA